MKKILSFFLLSIVTIVFAYNAGAQVTVGSIKNPPKFAEAFSALEIISNGKGGLRLPQLTSDQRNALALSAISNPGKKLLANGLSIYNTTTNCVEYWNNNRWISLCDGTSQTTISPDPCTNVNPDGTGCDQTFTITDPDCVNGPFTIAIVAGSDYASLADVNTAGGTFRIIFGQNQSVNSRSVLVRVTSSCTNQYKDFIFMQDGVTCINIGTPPTISPTSAALSLCSGGAVYLSVPPASLNLDKLIWTRNGIEVARGVNYYVATQAGTYNVSLGAAGCNVSATNERVITQSGTAPAMINTIIASNDGIICGAGGSITLTAAGATGPVSWFKNGELQSSKTGAIITLTSTDAGNWFAAGGSGGCYSKPSNTITVTVSNPTGTPININPADVLVNNTSINSISSFCAGGSLTLKINNPQPGVSYTWYNGEAIITSPYTIPVGQTSILLRMVATDNSGAACPVEARSTETPITSGVTPGMPTITGAGVICDGAADLTIVPQAPGTYTYQWYKNGALLPVTTQVITVTEPSAVYTATVTNTTGCVSPIATKVIAAEVSSLPVLSWITTGTGANFGDRITYEVALEHGPATYTWQVDGGATFTGSSRNITVTFPPSGAFVNITVQATNSCGTSAELSKIVMLSSACPTPSVTAASETTLSTIAGIGVQAKVLVTNGNQQTYQWYSNTAAATTGGVAISGATSATINYVPASATPSPVYLYCVVINGCMGTPQAPSTPLFTVNVTPDPATLDAGAGTFAGKTCFDINMSNYVGACGTESSRTPNMTNFKTQNVQPYVFTASATGTKRNLRFVIVDALGAIESTDADAVAVSGTVNNNQVVTLTVTYKNTLSDAGSIVYGKTTDQAVNVKIYAVYNNGTKDVAVLLNVKIQDCACCGAFIAAGVWKNFMCHNLGAVQTVDPFTPARELNGAYYNWGYNSPVSNPPHINDAFTNRGAYVGWNTTDKTAPCPPGYRVPTRDEWVGVLASNTYITVGTNWAESLSNFSSGIKFGNNLYLPANGFRNPSNQALYYRGKEGTYWSLTSGGGSSAYFLHFYKTSGEIIGTYPFEAGIGVRCIEK